METVTRRVIVSGRVQGVWFRGWTQGEAIRRGLTGWVRNRPDGTVEALLHGAPAAVEDMQAAMRAGPPTAAVTRVEAAPAPPHEAPGFEVRR